MGNPGLRHDRFNPTLVRLRRPARRPPSIPPWPFQSHAGSIEAPCEPPCNAPASPFQSHAGSIEASDQRSPGCAAEDVSIPRWFD